MKDKYVVLKLLAPDARNLNSISRDTSSSLCKIKEECFENMLEDSTNLEKTSMESCW